jgi:hypothetical protein
MRTGRCWNDWTGNINITSASTSPSHEYIHTTNLMCAYRDLAAAFANSSHISIITAARTLQQTQNTHTRHITRLQLEATVHHQQSLELHNRRFELLVRSLASITTHLEHIYKLLVPSGECFLRYPTDSVCLFGEGVSVCARQDSGNSASGGKFWEVMRLLVL